MQLQPALTQSNETIVFLDSLHGCQRSLCQVNPVNLKVRHKFDREELQVLCVVEELEKIV